MIRNFDAISGACAALALCVSAAASAQPARAIVLGDIVLGEGACAGARVDFNFPLRYVTHVPAAPASEFRVLLKPMAGNADAQTALRRREGWGPGAGIDTPLAEILYEGDIEGGPFIILRFNRTVRLDVSESMDFRGVDVRFHAIADACAKDNAKENQP